MLHYALVFIVVAIISAFLVFGRLSGLSATIAQVCVVLFLILALVSFLKKS